MAQELSPSQRKLAAAFVEAHQEFEQAVDDLKADRAKALTDAYNGGVYGTTLAEMSGLGTSRLYQLIDELGLREKEKAGT